MSTYTKLYRSFVEAHVTLHGQLTFSVELEGPFFLTKNSGQRRISRRSALGRWSSVRSAKSLKEIRVRPPALIESSDGLLDAQKLAVSEF